jgi:lycopene beta-cyclase
MKTYDYIITGSGASGLLLAYKMASDAFFDDKSILILDKEKKIDNDRTWCFWENKAGKWQHLVDKQWDCILFDSKFHSEKITILPYQYKMIRSSGFYKQLWETIDAKNNIEFIQAKVEKIIEEKDSVKVVSDSEAFIGNRVINSILLDDSYKTNQKYPALAQHFVGWFIKTKIDCFDDSTATFMDFTVPQNGNTRFMYVLPFSKNYALFEYTLFSKELLEKRAYEKAIKTYLEERNIKDYIIEEKETGVIPMSSFPFWKSNSKNILHIGTAGGWSRASTGFTFKNILKNVDLVTGFIKKEKSFAQFQKKNKHWFYDLLLLDILEKENHLGANLFARLFKRNNTGKIFKFLDEETSFAEDLKIMSTMPSGKFIKAIFRRLFNL